MNSNPLKKIVQIQKNNQAVGIYSCCSANEYVIKAVLKRGKEDNSCVLMNDPEELIVDRIGNTVDEYLYATHQKELF